MPHSENHVYFQVDDDGETVYVGGPRGTTPKL